MTKGNVATLSVYLSVFTVACIFSTTLHSCRSPSSILVTKPEEAFQLKQYAQAASLWQQQLERTNDSLAKDTLTKLIARAYMLAAVYDKALEWYTTAHNRNPRDIEILLGYAEALRKNNKYREAVELYTKYKTLPGANPSLADSAIKGCLMALKDMHRTSNIRIYSISEVNSPASDCCPATMDRTLLFASQRDEAAGKLIYPWNLQKFSDLFHSPLDEMNRPTTVSKLPGADSINTDFHEGTPTIIQFGGETYMYFTRCGSPNTPDTMHEYCHIYYSVLGKDGAWSSPRKIILFADTVNEGHPTFTPDGQIMVFASDAPAGFGGKDLYITYRIGDGWSEPQNLGKLINTPGDEMFPYFYTDSILLFASNGHVGYGGLDIYRVIRHKNGSWSGPYHMGRPINSGADDFGVVILPGERQNPFGFYEAMGFVSSNRPEGAGSDDLYQIVIEKPAFYHLYVAVWEKVYSEDTLAPSKATLRRLPDAQVHLFKLSTTADTLIADTPYADTTRYLFFELEPRTEYRIEGSKEGYLSSVEFVSTRKFKGSKELQASIKVDIILEPIIGGREIVIENIYYEFDKWNITPRSAIVLDTLAIILANNPDLKVELGSHTDCRGSDYYNMVLSFKRAQSAVMYLASKGISKERLSARGYGESLPVIYCGPGCDLCTEEQHAINRRTTFRVIGKIKEGKLIDIQSNPNPEKIEPSAPPKKEEEK